VEYVKCGVQLGLLRLPFDIFKYDPNQNPAKLGVHADLESEAILLQSLLEH
jgi:hypothetical protein